MRKPLVGALGASLAAGLLIGTQGLATAAPDDGGEPTTKAAAVADDLPNPDAEKQRALRESAIQEILNGDLKATSRNGSQVAKVGRKSAQLSRSDLARQRRGEQVKQRRIDQYVELRREQTDRVFVLLVEFGNLRHPNYPDRDTDPDTPGPSRFDGPLHNQIPEPDRTRDNSTIWQADYSADYFRRLYFGTGAGVESLKTYYQKQSSGRYSVEGTVTDWVKVRYNEARYGRSNGYPCASNVCTNTWNLVQDGMNQWVADQQAAGRTPDQIRADLASYDQWDRYDFDGDGNFNERDGYIDHLQIVHAGGDQADGDPYQGEDAIWSHRWKAFQNTGQGPTGNPDGGTQVGSTGIWAADYTVQAENGGLSTIAHEYGHDLGLPDHYDTAGGGDNPVNWWTLMAQSRARAKDDLGIGTRPADLGVWDKLQMGWLDYEVAVAGQEWTYRMGPHEYNSRKPQALVVVLPQQQVTSSLVAPASGSRQWWSGSDDDYTATLARSVALPAGPAQLAFKANFDIEEGYDFALVEVSTDGSTWTAVPTSLSTATAAATNGIDGTTNSTYRDGTANLSAYAGSTIQLRFRYTTDGGVAGNDANPGNNGFFVDDIAVTAGGSTVFTDNVEGGTNGWAASSFGIVGPTVTNPYDHYYLASYRAYVSYDRYLRWGPYNFGWANTRPDYVEFFPYQNGLLVNYWNTLYTDNNTSQHPGFGEVLPIDSHPRVIYRIDGQPWRGRIQTYDAPFGLERADSFTLHVSGRASYIRGRPAQPLFDDTRSYWNATLPNVGVKTPGVGVTLRVLDQSKTSMRVRLGVSPGSALATGAATARTGR